jgi:orotidine-5'-phosphate decarboxylase
VKNKVFVALDYTEFDQVKDLAAKLHGQPCGFKVGMELYYALGAQAVEFLAQQGFSIFLDLKLHDIPTTVHKALINLFKLPATMYNVHAAGGLAMLEAAQEARLRSQRKDVQLIAVTQLTSTTEEVMNRELKISGSLLDCVTAYAQLTLRAGLDGVVCSAHEVSTVKAHTKDNFLCVTPGIRPPQAQKHDQKRIVTPLEAIQAGADYLVVGRAITEAADPALSLEQLFLR